MPVRRKVSRRRQLFDYKTWEEYLALGHDLFADLYYAEIIGSKDEIPPRELTEEAWRVLGADIIAVHGPDCWGAREFGSAGT